MSLIANKRLSEVFKKSQKCLYMGSRFEWSKGGKEPYICYTLENLQHRGEISLEEYKQARRIIEIRLDGACFLENWLQWKHNISKDISEGTAAGRKRMQLTRRAWLKSLQKEFDKPGNYTA